MANTTFSCGLEAALSVLGGKWKPLILYNLAKNVHRYGELRRAIGGVTDKVLIQQLKELERDQVVARIDFQEIPPKVEYSLTPFGQSLATALGGLCEWGTEHMQTVERISERRASAASRSESAA
ncbi:helix-turn-helix transcriptional regulator [Xanthomonas sp. CFBP 8703]|jgi:DNA-binding HxlR family transcriptional regulator|uniref:Helix-turn-helix transcriptional regulator n=1 Tax=Xanthomonas bonasiae TaxID=2810351 RepID=A0ABS3B6L2_9XANT|nr:MULTISPECIES: helix-turn-helix domain-containing protein [Xanthomonas]MBD7920990.1 helix-turn-helix transcriptional regulator [Xanthomonas surreyensis]MBN6103841.1 helix-turn-helix transcriptional regulator [Xanthomonas bonasiae]MBN6111459.1 helix-turn-helix transcriptional regulator [Xanthomonas bonasiae]